MGMHRQMPDGMRRLHPHFRTPYLGILVFSAIAALALLPGQAEFLGAIYAFGAMLSFSMAHLALLRLRVVAARPRAALPQPGPRCGSAATTCRRSRCSGLAGTGVVAARGQRARPPGRRRRHAAGCCSGMATYVVYRRRQGLDLVSTHKVAIPEPVVDHEAEYDSVLVHVGDGRFDEQLLATAAKLAARRRRGIHVLVTITVPNALDDRRADAARRRPPPSRSSSRRGCRAGGASPATGRRSARARPGGGSSRRRRTCAPPPSCMALPRRVIAGRRCSAGRWRRCSRSARAGS